MDNTGEYGQPNPRRTDIFVPIVSDGSAKTTCRLRAPEIVNGIANLTGNSTLIALSNPGTVAVTVDIVQSTSANASSGRTALRSAQLIKPGGQVSFTLVPSQQVLEVRNAGATNGVLKMQLQGRLQWLEMAFAKDDALYPPKLWKANNVASQASLDFEDSEIVPS